MNGFEEFVGVNFWTALFTLGNFIILFVVAKKFLFVPVMKMINDRQQEIDDMYAQADAAKESAQALEAEYKAQIAMAQQTGDELVKAAMVRGKNREEEIIREANREADAIREKAAADIAREKKKAVNDAKNEISVIAVAIAGKVVGRELNDADHSRLVDAFIDELGDGV